MRRALSIGLGCAGLALATTAGADPTVAIAQARDQYARANYLRAIELLEPELVPKPLMTDEKELREARRLLGISYFYVDKADKARDQFVAILSSDPDFELDADAESQDVLTFFRVLKEEQKTMLERIRKLNEIEKKQREAAAKRPRVRVIIEREYRDPKPWQNWVPFGVGQFNNGQTRWGIVLLSSEAILGGVSVGTFVYQLAKWGTGGLSLRVPTDPGERTSLERLRVIQVGTGVMFLLVYGTGVVHAYANQRPPVLQKPPRYEVIDDPSQIDVLPPRSSSIMVTPLITSEGAGIGVSWEF